VRDELERLGAETVFLLGGESALNSQVEAQAEATGAEVIRIAGPDRYRTAGAAARVAVNLWRQSGEAAGEDVLVALGTDFPDALAAGALAGHTRRPLLLTTRDETLASRGARTATVVGGSAAVSDAVVARLRGMGLTVRRIAGASRHETAELAARAAVEAGAKDKIVLVASGRAFADALAAGPAAVQLDGVLLLTERDLLPPATRAWVSGRRPLGVLRLAGGAAAVSNAVEQELIAVSR
jgi:putative cell wall-binding protein